MTLKANEVVMFQEDLDEMDARIAALEAERDKLISEVTLLRRIERTAFCGDAAACSSMLPPLLSQYLDWCKANP